MSLDEYRRLVRITVLMCLFVLQLSWWTGPAPFEHSSKILKIFVLGLCWYALVPSLLGIVCMPEKYVLIGQYYYCMKRFELQTL